MLAVAAESDPERCPQRVAVFDRERALPPVVPDADSRMDRALLHRFSARREHAHCQLQVAIDDIPQRPRPWGLVIEQAGTRREAKHRQNPSVRQPFAKGILDKAGVARRLRHLLNETDLDPLDHGAAPASVAGQARRRKQCVADCGDLLRVPRDPFLDDVGHGAPRIPRRLVRGRERPSGCKSKLAMDAVAGSAGKEPQLHERPAQYLLRQHALQYLGPARIHVGRGRRIGRNPLGALKVVVVVAAAAA